MGVDYVICFSFIYCGVFFSLLTTLKFPGRVQYCFSLRDIYGLVMLSGGDEYEEQCFVSRSSDLMRLKWFDSYWKDFDSGNR